MSIEKESLIPYIDDGAEENQAEDVVHQCNLTITRNYQNKTRRVEISRILQDAEPVTNRSLSPVAPLACDSEGSDGDQSNTMKGAEFELTIKSNNSVIRIKGFDNKSTISLNAAKGGNVYDILSKEVDKILKRPEIDAAVGETARGEKKAKPVSRYKKNTWKMLTKSLMGMQGGMSSMDQRRKSVERYPKMVLLEPETKAGKEKKAAQKKLETEKSALRTESKELERCKTELIKEKLCLTEELKLLKEKREAMADMRSDLPADERFLKKEMNIIAEKKLCVELEKRLLGEEKVMLQEELDLLKKEKEMLEKERNLLGEEMNVLEEEKSNLEKKKSEVQGDRQRQESSEDVDEGFKGTLKANSTLRRRGKQKKTAESPQRDDQPDINIDDVAYSSVPPWYCHNPYLCPSVYVPVYNRPHCPYGCNDFSGGGRQEPLGTQNSMTQTTESALSDAVPRDETTIAPSEEPKLDKDMDLPFGLLSTFFPRIVVMKSFQEEVSGDDTDAKIFEIPKEEDIGSDEKEDEKGSEQPELGQAELGVVDLTEQKFDEGEPGKETEECLVDFDEVPETTIERPSTPDLPLTKIGYSICDKLNALTMERKREKTAKDAEEPEEAEDRTSPTELKKPSCNITFELRNRVMSFAVAGDNLNFRAQPGDRKHVIGDKMAVGKSELWHPNGGRSEGADHQNLFFTIRMGENRPRRRTNEAKVGTDGFDLAGGDQSFREGGELSPRRDEILKQLKSKLEALEGRNVKSNEIKLPELFLLRPSDQTTRRFPSDDYIMTKDRELRKERKPEVTPRTREYYCEDCLATMRLFEDEASSVKNIVDKFETIIQLGSY